MRAKYLNFGRSLIFFRIVFFFTSLLSASFTYAQQSEIPTKNQPATVVLKDGARIFSTDEAFNQQINSQAVILKNADRSPESKNSAKVLEATSSKPEVLKKDFKQEVKSSAEKKQKEELKKVKKEIDQHEARKKAFKINNCKGFPSSDEFLTSSRSNKDSLAPNCSNYNFSKALFSINSYTAKSALDFLYIQKFTYYNTISFENCFSRVYSVRPPPTIYFS